MSHNEIDLLLPHVEGWLVVQTEETPILQKTFRFPRYKDALEFSMAVGLAADDQDHHPRMIVEYKKVTIEWWTHIINGLHRNDFIMAAKTDEIYRSKESTQPIPH
ncbi:MAG: 4a-hydroxytetrahydrobiopterin dehydratase [Chloroflexota bacterium]